MGGYVMTEAKDTRERTTFGVTNAHVVFGSKFQPKRGLRCAYLTWGVTEREAAPFASDSIVIQSPGEETRRRNENQLRTTVAELEGQILNQTKIIEAVKESDYALAQRFDKHLKLSQSTLIELKDSLQLTERDASIGPVQAARLGYSHYETASSESSDPARTKLMMDLALVRMGCLSGKHPREIFLKANEEDPQILEHTTYNSWEVDSLGNSMDAEKHIKVVAKVSRQGVYAMGHVSHFKVDIDVPLQDKNGVKVLQKRSAWAISTLILNNKDSTRAGDSGSFIIAAHGWDFAGYDNKVAMPTTLNGCAKKPFVVGLLFGTSADGELTYFIPFDAVKSEIESMTGEEMVWPPKRSSCIQRWEEGYSDDEL